MNKIVLVLVLGLVSLWGAQIHSYKEAVSLQKQTKKTILLGIVRDGCHYCEDMEKNFFSDPEMLKYLNDKFIMAKVNISHEKLPLDLKVHFTPTFFILNRDLKVIKTIPGSWNKQDFKDLTRKIK